MENNNQDLNNIETIDFEDNNKPITNEVPNNQEVIQTPAEPIIPADDVNNNISADDVSNPQAQVLKKIEPQKQPENKKVKKEKNNALITLIIVFIFLMAFIMMLPKINELLTGI